MSVKDVGEGRGVVDAPPQDDARATQPDEKKLVRKLDLHLIPIIMTLYLFSFLDRYVLSYTL